MYCTGSFFFRDYYYYYYFFVRFTTYNTIHTYIGRYSLLLFIPRGKFFFLFSRTPLRRRRLFRTRTVVVVDLHMIIIRVRAKKKKIIPK